MTRTKPNLLVGTDVVDQRNIEKLKKYTNVYTLIDIDNDPLDQLLSTIDCLLVFSWPKELGADNLQKMKRLRFIQSILAGVNHVPFGSLHKGVVVSSNAGAYSVEVAEYAWALLLAAAKRIVQLHHSITQEKWTLTRTLDTGNEVTILDSKVLGILGFGGIGIAVAKMARGFGMKVYAYSRNLRRVKGARIFSGDSGLTDLLRQSDAVVLALPLTNQTTRIINRDRLSEMKKTAILVNIARGELVDENALYQHLAQNRSFRYATDVWWYRESRESLKTDHPLMSLDNFVGTPHVSGPSGLATGRPVQVAVENMIRFLGGRRARNIVDRNEYLTSYPY